ncbi:hypothetical protein GA0070616_2474 [Micromonospora nigra]|uniref:Uncharacterized protein n=1 Tax=Micromonospora nigra TaxID=145857 RepID=A0A1C6RY33_9ACTN|nr:hypothetical protein GA0070616_2474 [Micromonospora nigra]
MFGIGRRKTRGQLAKIELNQGIGHLRQAAAHAAKGAGATVGPRVHAARGAVAPTAVMVRDRASSGLASTAATLAPLALAVRHAQAEAAGKAVAGRKATAAKRAAVAKKMKAKNMKKRKTRRRGSMMTGLLAAGAVAGVVGAMALRRRREQQEWAEYDPTSTLEPMHDDVETIEVRTAPSRGTNPATGSTAAGSTAAGSTAAGSSAVVGGDSASTTTATSAEPKITPTGQVPSVAEGATDTSGRPDDDLTKALGKDTAKSNGRH